MEWTTDQLVPDRVRCDLTAELCAVVSWNRETEDPVTRWMPPFEYAIENRASGELNALYRLGTAATLDEAKQAALQSFEDGPDPRNQWPESDFNEDGDWTTDEMPAGPATNQLH